MNAMIQYIDVTTGKATLLNNGKYYWLVDLDDWLDENRSQMTHDTRSKIVAAIERRESYFEDVTFLQQRWIMPVPDIDEALMQLAAAIEVASEDEGAEWKLDMVKKLVDIV